MPEMVGPAQYDAFADDVVGLPGVVGAEVVARDDALQRPMVELTIGPDYQRVPPRVLRCIAEHDLGVRPGWGGTQADGYLRLVVV